MMHQISTVKLRVRGCYYSSERINSGEGGGCAQLVEALLCKPKGRGFDWNTALRSTKPLTEMSTKNIFWGGWG